MNKKIFLIGLVLLSIFITSCSMNNNDDNDSSNTVEDGIDTVSVKSLVNRQKYINVYVEDASFCTETEHWYYDSTNKITNYTVTTYKNIPTNGGYQEVIFVFSDDPKLAKTNTGDMSMYDTDTFITTYSPDTMDLYTGKYIYIYNSNGNCTSGAYIGKNETAITNGCFVATYGNFGYTSFKEAESGSFTVDNNFYTITVNDATVCEYRVCNYDNNTGNYTDESFYTDAAATNLFTKYTCKYDTNNKPLLEVKYEPKRIIDADNKTSGNFEAKIEDEHSGEFNNDINAAADYVSNIIFVFDTNNNGVITVQKTYKYAGSETIPVAANITKADYSSDNELLIISTEYDSNNRKTKKVENSYGNKIKSIEYHYDDGTTDENGLASETTYDSKDLMLCRSTYELVKFNYSDETGTVKTVGDTETYEVNNYEFSTSRSYLGEINTWGLTPKRPHTVHWSEL